MKRYNIQSLVKDVEKNLQATLTFDHPISNESLYLLNSGGKRIRPLFTILAGIYNVHNEEDKAQLIQVATILEVIHMASLVHDDIIDLSVVRRGNPTVNARIGDQRAIHVGNVLLTVALQLANEVNHDGIHKALSQTMIELTVGELNQMNEQFDVDQSYTTYLRRIKRKTANLIALSAQMGAMSVNLDQHKVNQYYRIGYYIGMSFQIVDDYLDYIADESTLGKPKLQDLKNGHITLPILYSIKKDPELKELIIDFKHNPSEEQLSKIISHMNALGGIEKSREVSKKYLNKAKMLIDDTVPKEHVKTWMTIIKKIEKRMN